MDVHAVRLWAGPDNTRIVLDLSGSAQHSLAVLGNPERVVLDVPGAPGWVRGWGRAAGVTADYFEIDSDFGHSASGLDAAKWAPRLKAFMATLQNRS